MTVRIVTRDVQRGGRSVVSVRARLRGCARWCCVCDVCGGVLIGTSVLVKSVLERGDTFVEHVWYLKVQAVPPFYLHNNDLPAAGMVGDPWGGPRSPTPTIMLVGFFSELLVGPSVSAR